MKKTLLSTLALVVMLGASHFAAAQSSKNSASASESAKPMVTVAFSGYDALKANLELIGKLGGNPNIAQGLEMMITMMTQGEGLAAIDQQKPWAAFLVPAPGAPQVAVFVPVTSVSKFIGLLEKLGMQPKSQGDDVYTIEGPESTITVKKSGGFALIASGDAALSAAPSDPLKVLGGLETKYDLAVRISAANVPAEYKQMATASIKALSQAQMRKLPGEEDDAYKARVGLAKQSVQQVVDLINETDEVLLGWSVNKKTNSTYLDIRISAIADTKLAKQLATVTDAKTSYPGVTLPGAAVTANWARTMTDEEVAQAKNTMKQVRVGLVKDLENQDMDDGKRDLAKQLIADLFGIFEKTLDGKKTDGGMSLVLDPDALKIVFAGNLSDGDKLEKAFQKLVPEIEKEAKAKVKLNAETYKAVRLHTISIPIPEGPKSAQAVKVLGKTADVVLGVSDSAVYIAAGRDAMKTLKTVVDNSKTPKTIAPVAVSIAVSPIVKFVAAMSEDDPQAQMTCQMISGMLEKSAGKDHVTIMAKGMSNGAAVRIELEEGLLALIGGASQMAAGPAPGAEMAPGEMPVAKPKPRSKPAKRPAESK